MCRQVRLISPPSFGYEVRAKDGRQHSSRIVPWSDWTAPLVCGRPARMRVAQAPSLPIVSSKRPRNSLPSSVSTRLSRQPAACNSCATVRASLEVWAALDCPRGQETSSAQA
jgi:hypothetical protein